jgi:hypothetical protein
MNRGSTSTIMGRGNSDGAVLIRPARLAVSWRVCSSLVGRGRHTESRAHVESVVAADEVANLTLAVADTRNLARGDVGEALALGLLITDIEAVLDGAHISTVVGVDRAVEAGADFVVHAIGVAVAGSFGSCTRA